MIHQQVETEHASYERLYTLEARGNDPYLILSSVEFTCRVCGKHASVDLSVVPVHEIQVKCDVCNESLFSVPEIEFEYMLEIVEKDMPGRGADYFMTVGGTDLYT